jgi:hypothetical protein
MDSYLIYAFQGGEWTDRPLAPSFCQIRLAASQSDDVMNSGFYYPYFWQFIYRIIYLQNNKQTQQTSGPAFLGFRHVIVA